MEREHVKSFREAYDREKRIVLSLPLHAIQKALATTIIIFSLLNILDIVTTLYNLSYVQGAFEANNILGPLLTNAPIGTIAAILIKIEIIVLLLAIYFYSGRFRLATTVLKLGTLAGLIAVLPIYIWGVMLNNIPILMQSIR
jgi:hypothetical protein